MSSVQVFKTGMRFQQPKEWGKWDTERTSLKETT